MLAVVDRSIELNAPDLVMSRHIQVTIQAKKFKSLGTDILLCKGFIPMSSFLEKPQESVKMKIALQTPSDNVSLAILFINISKVGFRLEEDDPLV